MTLENDKLIETYMRSCMDACAHDVQHVYRVLKNAERIAEGMAGVNTDVLRTAALLHDIGRPVQLADPSKDHALVGGDMAYDFLVKNGFAAEFARRVKECIVTHRFRKSRPPESIEAKILFDADKLDVTGAVGVARTLLYNGQTGRPLYAVDAAGEILTGEADETPSFFREYHFKLKNLYDRFYTEKGAALAKERQKAAAEFYEALLKEIRGE